MFVTKTTERGTSFKIPSYRLQREREREKRVEL